MDANTLYEQCMSMDESAFESYVSNHKHEINNNHIVEFAQLLGGNIMDQANTICTMNEWLNF